MNIGTGLNQCQRTLSMSTLDSRKQGSNTTASRDVEVRSGLDQRLQVVESAPVGGNEQCCASFRSANKRINVCPGSDQHFYALSIASPGCEVEGSKPQAVVDTVNICPGFDQSPNTFCVTILSTNTEGIDPNEIFRQASMDIGTGLNQCQRTLSMTMLDGRKQGSFTGV